MLHIGAVAALFQGYRRAVVGVGAELAQHRAAALAGFGQQNHGAVEADGEHVIALLQRFELVVMFDIGAEAPDAGADHLAAFGMRADIARQRQQADGGRQIDHVRHRVTRQRNALGLAFAVLADFPQLDVIAERPLAQGNRQV